MTGWMMTPEMVAAIEAMAAESSVDSVGQPVPADEVGVGERHNNAQRGFMMQMAYEIAVAVRRQRGD